MGTLDNLARLLVFYGRAERRWRTLRFWPARSETGHDVAQLNGSNDVVLLPVYAGDVMVHRARTVGKREAAEDVAAEIVNRLLQQAA